MVKIAYFFFCILLLSACCGSYWESNQLSAVAGVFGDTTMVRDYSIVYYGNGENLNLSRWSINEYPYYVKYLNHFCDVPSAESSCGCSCTLSLKNLTVSIYLQDNKNDTLFFLKKVKVPSDGLKRLSLETQVSLGKIEGKIPPRKFFHFDYKKSQSMFVDVLKDSVYYYTVLKGKEDSYVYSDWTEIVE